MYKLNLKKNEMWVGCGLEVVGGRKSKTGGAMSIAAPISSNKNKTKSKEKPPN